MSKFVHSVMLSSLIRLPFELKQYLKYIQQQIHKKFLLVMLNNRPLLLVFLMVCFFGIGSANEKYIEYLGFQSWEEPTPEQIKDQFAKITQAYNQNMDKDVIHEARYRKATEAFNYFKARNFVINEESSHTQSGSNWNQRWSKQREKQKKQPYNYRQRQAPNQQGYRMNIDDILKNLDMDFVTVSDEEEIRARNNQFANRKLDMNFFKWLMQNPIILLAALLVSIGIINLCTCCFCCCCRCFWKKEQKSKVSAPVPSPSPSPMAKMSNAQHRKVKEIEKVRRE